MMDKSQTHKHRYSIRKLLIASNLLLASGVVSSLTGCSGVGITPEDGTPAYLGSKSAGVEMIRDGRNSWLHTVAPETCILTSRVTGYLVDEAKSMRLPMVQTECMNDIVSWSEREGEITW
jgi:hypothetical protein